VPTKGYNRNRANVQPPDDIDLRNRGRGMMALEYGDHLEYLVADGGALRASIQALSGELSLLLAESRKTNIMLAEMLGIETEDVDV